MVEENRAQMVIITIDSDGEGFVAREDQPAGIIAACLGGADTGGNSSPVRGLGR